LKKFPYKTLIGSIAVFLIVLTVFGFIYLSGSGNFPSLKIEVFKIFNLETDNKSVSENKKYNFSFDNQSLSWAINYLNKKAKDVNIILDSKIESGVIVTKRFSVHIDGADLDEVLDIFCSSAKKDVNILWQRDGKRIIIKSEHLNKTENKSLPYNKSSKIIKPVKKLIKSDQASGKIGDEIILFSNKKSKVRVLLIKNQEYTLYININGKKYESGFKNSTYCEEVSIKDEPKDLQYRLCVKINGRDVNYSINIIDEYL